MVDFTIKFLGKEYIFPLELKLYIEYLQWFNTYYDKAMEPLLHQMKKLEYSSSADEDFIYFRQPMIQIAQEIIQRLAEQGIYDVTISDLVDNNSGYIKLRQVCAETFNGMKQIFIDSVNEFQSEMNKAYSSAASNITGSGVSIWTNSLSSALLYTVMESGTIKKQVAQAEREYGEALAELSERNNNKQQQREMELKDKIYYPNAAEAINLFVSNLFEMYIKSLERKGAFDFAKVSQFDLKRSEDILNNISLVSNKKSVIEQAFLICPFNQNIYIAVLENDLCDLDTFKTAYILKQGNNLLPVIKEYCKNNKNDWEKIAILMQAWEIFEGQEITAIIRCIYENEIEKIYKCYETLRKITSGDKTELDFWIKENINEDYFEQIDNDDFVRYAFKEYISRNIINIPDKGMEELLGKDVISVRNLRLAGSSATDMQTINLEIEEALCKLVIQRLRIANFQKEQCSRAYDELLQNVESVYNELTGLIAKKRLSKLDERKIEELKEEYKKYVEKPEAEKLENQFYEIFKFITRYSNNKYMTDVIEKNRGYSKLKDEFSTSIRKLTEQKSNIKNKKIRKFVMTSVILGIFVAIIWIKIISPMQKYNKAIQLMNDQEYEQAQNLFCELEDYKDSINKISEIKYNIGMDYFEQGDYENATLIFFELGDFYDSNEKYNKTKELLYNEAIFEYKQKNYENAIRKLDLLGEYADAAEIRNSSICSLAIEKKNTITAANSEVVVNSDGTVEYWNTDENSWEKINDWEDIKEVSGTSAIIGLKSDGTVVIKDSKYTELEKESNTWQNWTNIISVAASYDGVLGLRQDGKVSTAGRFYSGLGLGEVIEIGAGYYMYAGVKKDGTANYRGTSEIVTRRINVGKWTEIQSIAVGDNYIMGLKEDGTVVFSGLNQYGQCNGLNWKDIIAISASGFVSVGLRKDGTVVATGDNENGQCEVLDWDGIVAISTNGNYTMGLRYDGSVVSTARLFE